MPDLSSHTFDPTILREYDIRGLVGKTLHETDAFYIGAGFGSVLKEQGQSEIAVGNATRALGCVF